MDRDELISRLSALPALPAVTTEVMELVGSGSASFAVLERAISVEPALAARILAVANSPFYGFKSQIGSLKQACLVIGMQTIRNIVLSLGVLDKLGAKNGSHLDLSNLWRHAMGTAFLARELARPAGLEPEEVFTAGLMHDIGKMVLDIFFGDDYAAVMRYQRDQDCPIRTAEETVLGFDHAFVGARTAEHWRLPAYIVEAIEYHHSPLDTDSPCAQLINVADTLCRRLEMGNPGDSEIPEIDQLLMHNLGLDESAVERAISRLSEVSGDNAAMGVF